jgi:hypothetical protein
MSAINGLIKQIAGEAAAWQKEDYINSITELLNECSNINVLDLIYQLLQKSQ